MFKGDVSWSGYLLVDIPCSFAALLLKNYEAPYPNHGRIILADPSPILCYHISHTEIRRLVDIPGMGIVHVVEGFTRKSGG